MKNETMRYPERAAMETKRQRDRRAALSRRVVRQEPQEARPARHVVRVTPKGVRMPLAVFQAADYGQVCQLLGLRPSKPERAADGRRLRRDRGTSYAAAKAAALTP